MSGKIVLVTGAAMGNGKGGATVFARYGAHVILADISSKISETETELKKEGYSVSSVVMDVRDAKSVKETVDSAISRFKKIDVLFNNAGVAKLEPFLTMSDELRDFHFDVNIKGIWNVAKAVFPYMVNAKYGRIVNMSSVTGPMVVDAGETAYATTKAAIWGFTKALAYEGASYGITVNSICPGYVRTPMAESLAADSNPSDPEAALKQMASGIPLRRLCTIEEIGELAVFLSSDEAGYITGTQVVIDGGSTLPETFGVVGVQ
jgi:NAD(P)-dependent dehydrogenase (short-subunit alcohol dehydrogenase family)